MQELEKRIREFGKKAEWIPLQQYIEDVDVENVINLIKRKINNPDFESLWNYLLHSFTDSYDSRKRRFQIISSCMDTLRENEVNTTNANAVVSRLCGELVSFKTDEIVSLCQLCLEYIQKGNVTEACWRKLLPELLNVILRKDHVEYNDADLTGFEYKTQVLNSLAFMEWSANIVIPLTAMFIDMPLTKDEHLEITNKLGRYVEKFISQELPTFVYHFLQFCRHQNGKVIFFHLQHYFGMRIYSKYTGGSEPNSESMDLISDASDEEVLQAESTILFHIYQAALLGHESIKEYLSFLKKLTKIPEFILHPFQLTMLLSISAVACHESVVFTIIKQSVSRHFYEKAKISESSWLNSMVSHGTDVNCVFKQIIEYSAKDRDLVLQGLVNLSFILLGVGALLGRESQIVTKQWNLGKYILLSLIQQKTHISQSVLRRLCNEIVGNTSTPQHIDCFSDFSKRFTLLTLENKACVVELMETLLQLSNNVSQQVLDSIIPLTKVSPTLRDHLILLLRKALHSRNASTRQMAVKGFLNLLKNLKISSLATLSAQLSDSQSSSSMRSVLTQISINCTVHSSQANIFSNEALCLEVLGILKRCFMQPAEIRGKLYEGLHGAVSKNPEIGGAVLDVLWAHFTNYYVSDESVSPPIKFEKISSIRDMDVVLEEPIGKLIFAVGLIVIKVLKIDEDNLSAKRFLKVLDSVISRMVNCELVHFELDEGSYLLDILPECQKKIITLTQAISVYEALIGYRVASWEKTSENYAQDISGLFQGYFRLQRCALEAHRSKKSDKKKKDANKSTNEQNKDSSQQSRTSQSATPPSKNKPKVKNIKIPDTVLEFKTVTKFLNLLHCNVEFTSTAQANILKSKNEIHRHVMQATINLFQNLKMTKMIDKHKKHYNHCTSVATIIYKRCIERMDEFVDFDPITTVLAAECFQIILSLVCTHYKENLSKFLCAVGNLKETEFQSHINPFIEKYEELFEMDFNDGTGESDGKKLKLIIVSTLALLVQQLPNEVTVPSNKFLEWIKTYSSQNSLSHKPVVSTFLGLWFSSYVKFKSSLSVFEEIVDNLLRVYGSLEDKEGINTFEIVNEITAHTFIEKLSATMKVILEDIDWVILRLQSKFSVVKYPGSDSVERRKEELKTKERGVCCQLCFAITLLDSLCTIVLPTGNLSEAILKNIIELYTCLNNLAKYFLSRSSKINPVFQGARFDRVVKLAGRQLLPSMNKFILHMEETQTESESHDRKKKSSDMLKNKVLRETKLIPKAVYETEQFSKLITQLSKKTKVDISKFIGPGTTRDFRIKDINSVLKKNSDHDSSLDKTVTDESVQENDEEDQDSQDDSDEESQPPPVKKSKK